MGCGRVGSSLGGCMILNECEFLDSDDRGSNPERCRFAEGQKLDWTVVNQPRKTRLL